MRALRRGLVIVGRGLFGFIVIAWSLGPILWAMKVSLSTQVGLEAIPIQLTPDPVTLEHYNDLLDPGSSISNAFYLALRNSLIEATAATVLIVAVASFSGYAFARWKFGGSRFMFVVILSTLSLPLLAVLIPLYRTAADFGLLDTYSPIVLLAVTASLPLALWIMRSFVESLPQDIEAAARLDGANEFRILWHIIIPLLGPAIAAMAIITFLAAWSAFLVPLFFSHTANTQPLTVFIPNLVAKASQNLGLQAAAACLSLLTPVLLVVGLNRLVTSGLIRGAIK